ncbi:ammonium transporter Rh type B isoform X2 [Parasteatoda tepidariorum]|uniref:ammonium transporter Rh type B isoform X2 n=1 Tax=Parasteatoda tepidariorum TaxID=114398 RepID=UPI001C729087|nr:ammonium transporter Rh type A isoform X2 [Parasteatoda tepidariorum]
MGLGKTNSTAGVKSRSYLNMALKKKFAITVLFLQILFIILFAFFVEYGQQVDANQDKYPKEERVDPDANDFHAIYPMFQHVNVVIFVGVGFLYTFLKKYSFMGVGMNMLLAALSIQWSIFTHNCWSATEGKIHIDIRSIIWAEFAAASAVISLGGIFGKANPLQMVAFTMIETFLYTTNEYFVVHHMKVTDLGGAVSLHLFASLFGLATAYTMDKKTNVQNNINEASSYSSDISCMLGTVLLWCFWPSFNAALSVGDAQHRAVMNTFLAFTASCLAAFAMTSLMDKKAKFTMSHIQNATLAGGVAVGATCELMIQPFGALLIGLLGGSLCVIGFHYMGPFLKRINIMDACAINSLHTLPGFLAGLTGIFAALIGTVDNYGHSLYRIYPAMAPPINSNELADLQAQYPYIQAGESRTPANQACFQAYYMIECIIAGIILGLLNGLFLRMKMFDPLEEKQLYLDETFWNMPDNENGYSQTKSNIINVELNDLKM